MMGNEPTVAVETTKIGGGEGVEELEIVDVEERMEDVKNDEDVEVEVEELVEVDVLLVLVVDELVDSGPGVLVTPGS
jgi:hypothetical protein